MQRQMMEALGAANEDGLSVVRLASVVGYHREGCRGVNRQVGAPRIRGCNDFRINCVDTCTPIELATNLCGRYARHQERDRKPDPENKGERQVKIVSTNAR